jgi:hypothetical protein
VGQGIDSSELSGIGMGMVISDATGIEKVIERRQA